MTTLQDVGADVGVDVGVSEAVGVSEGVSVAVGVGVSVSRGAGVSVAVSAGVNVSVGAGSSVAVGVGVSVAVGVDVSVGVSVGVGVSVTWSSGTRTGAARNPPPITGAEAEPPVPSVHWLNSEAVAAMPMSTHLARKAPVNWPSPLAAAGALRGASVTEHRWPRRHSLGFAPGEELWWRIG